MSTSMDNTDNNNRKNQNNPLNVLYYENRELELLKNAINIEAKKRGQRIAQNPIMKQIITVLEKFISDKHLVCYGGTAINNSFILVCKQRLVYIWKMLIIHFIELFCFLCLESFLGV